MGRPTKLKTRLKLKYLCRKVDEIIKWNFGYCPTDSIGFDNLLQEIAYYEKVARNYYPDIYQEHLKRDT